MWEEDGSRDGAGVRVVGSYVGRSGREGSKVVVAARGSEIDDRI